jgi:hypothetical protein
MFQLNPIIRENIRDSFAARMIINKVLKEYPKAKILVHGGRAHVGKFNIDSLAIMAWHFRAFSGITPFSIDQLQMSPFNNPIDESSVYQYVRKKYALKVPV